MKKSVDYFKMLKEMSYAVLSAYDKMISLEDFNGDLIKFSGVKWELLNNILNEFVAPIERNDIYYLVQNLSEEMYYISNINTFSSLVKMNEFNFKDSITSVLKNQTEVLVCLKDYKNHKRLFKSISEAKATLNGVNTSINLYCKAQGDLLTEGIYNFVMIQNFSGLYKSIDKSFSEVQRIIINNN